MSVVRREWQDTTLGACAILVRDLVSPTACGDAPYVGLEHIGKGTFSLLGTGSAKNVESTKAVFRAGDILFGKLRPYFRKVVRPTFSGICSTDIWVVRPVTGIDPGYLLCLLASEDLADYATQGAEGTRMPRANWKHVSDFPVALPPLSEQRSIARVIDVLSARIDLNRRMGETLASVVGTLLPNLISGEVCTEELNRIVEAAT